MSAPVSHENELVDIVDMEDRVVGQGRLVDVQIALKPHRAFLALIHNEDGHFLLKQNSASHPLAPNCWDLACEGDVRAGEDYAMAVRRSLAEDLSVADVTFPLRPFLKIPASLETSLQFIQVFTFGPTEGPFEPTRPDTASIAFASVEDIDAYISGWPDQIAESLKILWRSRAEIVQEMEFPSEEAPLPAEPAPEPEPILAAPTAAGAIAPANGAAPTITGIGGKPLDPRIAAELGPGTAADVSAPPPGESSSPKGLMGWIGGAALLVYKFGFFLLKFAKVWLSMLLMIWVYSERYGWPFATGFVLLIFVHEMGHIIAARWAGIPVSAPMFIPFVGAFITMKENPRDAWTEAVMAYGGPLAGCIGAVVCLIAGVVLKSPLLFALASSTFVMNLFNMAPFPPLDGGRICAAVSTWFWLLGVVALGFALVFFHGGASIVLILLILFFGFKRFKSAFWPSDEEQKRYYDITLGGRFLMGGLYFGLMGFMLVLYLVSSVFLYQHDPRERDTEDETSSKKHLQIQ